MRHGGHVSAEALDALSNKRRVTLCVTDDGLGGLSVLSEIERKLQLAPSSFEHVALLYINAAVRPAIALRPIDEQVATFDSALRAMITHAPDAILIACGSLSVLYPRTAFSRATTTPVLNIVDSGIDLLAGALIADPTSVALVFATVVTTQVGAHRQGLIERGIAPERIVMQACPELAYSIQTFGADSPAVEKILSHCVHEAWMEMCRRGLAPPARVYAGLCCSHYGYSLPLWQRALATQAHRSSGSGGKITETICINPNISMAERIFDSPRSTQSERCEAGLRVLSKIELHAEIGHIAPFLSPRVSAALRAYEHQPGLFEDVTVPTRSPRDRLVPHNS